MKERHTVVVGLLIGLGMVAFMPTASAQMEAGKAFNKLTRGFVNIVTGWVEVPKRVYETSQASGAWAGFTWGLLRGLGHGFVRTAAGLYEFVTFPFPAPPNYESVIQPEYVFLEEPQSTGSQYR